MFLSGYEVAARQIRQAAEQRDRLLKAQETAKLPTPGHSAAAAANEYAHDNAEAAEAQRRRARVQHEVDPYPDEAPGVDEVDLAELGKRYNQAFEGGTPEDYPPMRPVRAEQFRRAPATAEHAACSAAYENPGRPVPVPSETLKPGMVTRPLLTDGRSRPSAPRAS